MQQVDVNPVRVEGDVLAELAAHAPIGAATSV